MVKFITHKEMRSRLRQVKQFNPGAKVMGLDVGRRYTGIALSDAQLTIAKPFKTIQVEPLNAAGEEPPLGVEGDLRQAQRFIKSAIRGKQVKGLVVGYPLDLEGNPTRHCDFVVYFLEMLARESPLRVPVTLVNEYGSTVAAKVQIAEQINRGRLQNLLIESQNQAISNLHPVNEEVQMPLDPQVMLRKGIYDKVAAKVVLQKYLDFHHDLQLDLIN